MSTEIRKVNPCQMVRLLGFFLFLVLLALFA